MDNNKLSWTLKRNSIQMFAGFMAIASCLYAIAGCDKQVAGQVSSSSGQNNVSARAGEDIYHNFCFGCHDHGVAGAPKFNRKSDWSGRLLKGKNGLVDSVISGLGAMPRNGSCFDCNLVELNSVVEFMLSKVSEL